MVMVFCKIHCKYPIFGMEEIEKTRSRYVIYKNPSNPIIKEI